MKRYFLLSALIHLLVFLLVFSFKEIVLLNNFTLADSSVEIFFSKNDLAEGNGKEFAQNEKNLNYEKAGIETLRQLVKSNEPPRYPLLALRNNWSGEVMLRFFINSSGKLDNLSIISSSGYPLLDRAALLAAQNWRFLSSNKNVQIDYPVKFVLKDS